MKAVILAGGLGTRISEETVTHPKPMVEIGGKPILWHIMKIYSASSLCGLLMPGILMCGRSRKAVYTLFIKTGVSYPLKR